jgi:hypothetical protein
MQKGLAHKTGFQFEGGANQKWGEDCVSIGTKGGRKSSLGGDKERGMRASAQHHFTMYTV